jgi:hypothetical protein
MKRIKTFKGNLLLFLKSMWVVTFIIVVAMAIYLQVNGLI